MTETAFRLPGAARLHDPAFYLGDPHPYYEQLRRRAPVYWYEPDDPEYLPFWVVTRHALIRRISLDTEHFTAAQGILINDNTRAARAGGNISSKQIPAGAEPLAITDPPRHTQLRALAMKAFTPRLLYQQEEGIRQIVDTVLAAVPEGETFDFVEKVAVPIPIYVIARMLGVPTEDWADFKRWADDVVAGGGAITPELLARMQRSATEIQAYLTRHIEQRRRAPQEDLISALSAVEHQGERFNFPNLLLMARTILAAGNETTRNSLSLMIWELLQQPEQLRLLQQRPELVPGAVDELLRYVTTTIGMCRRVTRDIELEGQRLRAGDFVHLNFQAANRDETVWDDAHRLDVTRRVDPMHLAFGHGRHICMGATLARLELRVALERLLQTFARFELAGERQRIASNLINTTAALPLRCYRQKIS